MGFLNALFQILLIRFFKRRQYKINLLTSWEIVTDPKSETGKISAPQKINNVLYPIMTTGTACGSQPDIPHIEVQIIINDQAMVFIRLVSCKGLSHRQSTSIHIS